MSNVRARIAEIEARQRESEEEKDDSGKERSDETTAGKRKRFPYPGKRQRSQDLDQQILPLSSTHKTKQSAITNTDFEAHLQEVWSVRRNIHHIQPPSLSTTSNSKTSLLTGNLSQTHAEKYSRHSAIPAQQPHSPRRDRGICKKDEQILGSPRSPLHEQNSIETPWNTRKAKSKFNYTESDSKQSLGTATAMETSPAATKRRYFRGDAEPVKICKEHFEPAVTPHRDTTEKLSYAKKMAKGYLRSVGIGEYTPKRDSYYKEVDSPNGAGTPKWKSTDSDEFDF